MEFFVFRCDKEVWLYRIKQSTKPDIDLAYLLNASSLQSGS